MSTKVTKRSRARTAERAGFHIYEDALDEFADGGSKRPVYLQLDGVRVQLESLETGGALVTIVLTQEDARELGLLERRQSKPLVEPTCRLKPALRDPAHPNRDQREALRSASNDLLADALRERQPGDPTEVSRLAFQAGYFALLSTVDSEIRAASDDHPNAETALQGASCLSLSTADQQLADLGAKNYYEPTSLTFLASPQDWIAWAERARAAAGMTENSR